MRGFGSNARRAVAVIGVEDDYARMLSHTLAVTSLPQSPAARGPAPFIPGLPGSDVNECAALGSPQQSFAGVDPRAINLAATKAVGDELGGTLPASAATIGSAAWLDMKNLSRPGMS